MWDLAPYFHAAIVFAEHRYYGESKPYGKGSYMVLSSICNNIYQHLYVTFALII